ncbi:hypothetical protein PV325_012245 [Microctonus aethiopoides]|nr:hypothetical protein PV325_012245 [Microctonus aethiopoides]KAK0092702.1 hypothetical protein PV326_000791 [Microctonus aethiopoides]
MAITTEQTTIEPLLTEEITTETITEEPQTFEPMPIVGDEYCTWGPSYWCHNKTTAAECNATTYCINNVWSENIREKKEVTTETTITEEPTTFEPMPIGGDDQCTWGPSYWCQNKTTAAECNATTYCTNNVWSENTKDLIIAVVCKVSGICDSLLDDELIVVMNICSSGQFNFM